MPTITLSFPSTPIPSAGIPSPPSTSSLDDILTSFLSTWSLTSTLLLLSTLIIFLYPLIFAKDPDTHPFLLARQSTPAPIRNENESPVYRALDVPHGYPLRHSLGVRDKGAAKWSPGRAGDVRDIWRQAALGPVGDDGQHDASKVGKVLLCLGREGVREVSMAEVTGLINALGEWVRGKGDGKKVVVSLSNGVELLACIFAAAFHDFSLTLLPANLSADQTSTLLSQINADILVAGAGVFDFDAALSSSSSSTTTKSSPSKATRSSSSTTNSIKDVVLVATGGAKDIDWEDSLPKGVSVTAWDNVVATGKSAWGQEVLPLDKETAVKPIYLASAGGGEGGFEVVEFSSQNIISGVTGLNVTLARDNKLNNSDVFLPTSSLTDSYTLCWTLAALYANASVALNSVAGDNVSLAAATASVQPTVLVAAPATINKFVFDTIKAGGGPGSIGRYFARQSLQAGVMPTKRPSVAIGSLSKLRLVLVGQPASQQTRLSSSSLHELRMLLGARVLYGLTAPRVAGAVSQSVVHDYRDHGEIVTLGPPLGSVEIHLAGPEVEVGGSTPRGTLVVKGPSVSGGKTEVDILAQVHSDHTLRLL